jgi:hypothetical protein
VAAHSMVRGLYSSYVGTLYTLKRSSDNATLDISPLAPGGYANASAHDEFCSAAPHPTPTPAPPPPSQLLPPLGTQVTLAPLSNPTYTFRHCYSQGFITPSESSPDHTFKLVAGLDGTPTSVSFQSVNYPGSYIAPVSGAEPGRVGILATPSPAEATWMYTRGPSGGVILTSLAPSHTGAGLVVGGNLTGICAHSYTAPAGSVYLQEGGGDAWSVSAAAPGPASMAACVVSRLYDQTGNGNHLLPADPGINNPAYDLPVNATRHPITVGGHKVYGAFFEGGMGYRARNTTGVARGNDPETLYMVTSGLHVNDGCVSISPTSYIPSLPCCFAASVLYFRSPLHTHIHTPSHYDTSALTMDRARTFLTTPLLFVTGAWRRFILVQARVGVTLTRMVVPGELPAALFIVPL